MVNFDSLIQLLHDKRCELLEQLKAVDRAIGVLAASSSATPQPTNTASRPTVEADPPVIVVPPKRVLTEAHKTAMRDGRLKAREAKLLQARGLEPGKPAIFSQRDPVPRLVKRAQVREFTVEPLDDEQEALVS
jgi:hypothetical protein